jgi:hypothetical protein
VPPSARLRTVVCLPFLSTMGVAIRFEFMLYRVARQATWVTAGTA